MTKEEEIEEELLDCSDEEKIENLTRSVRYWYEAAEEWCELYGRERRQKYEKPEYIGH